jgi:ATP-dependent RNA helicase DHX29
LRLLTEVGAVQIAENGQESLSALGLYVAKIPIHVRLAKMLIFGAVFKCLDPVLTIVASLSGKSPFATVMNDASRARYRRPQEVSRLIV